MSYGSTAMVSDSPIGEETGLLLPSAEVEEFPPKKMTRPRKNSLLSRFLSVSIALGIVLIVTGLSVDSEIYDRFQALDFSPRQFHAQLLADRVGINRPPKLLGSSRYSSSKHHHDHKPNLQLSSPDEGCEGTVMIVRHCEKLNLKSHCDYVGFERSAYLAELFGNDGERWPAPSHIYALEPGHRNNPKKHNYREVETVQAISDKFDLKIDEAYSTADTAHLADTVLEQIKTGQVCGKVLLISWKHSDIPKLARKLGCGPLEGCPVDYKGSEFDQVWQLKYVYRKFPRNDKTPKNPYWRIYGTTQNEGFDPLAYSKKMGDYISKDNKKNQGYGNWQQVLQNPPYDN